MPIIRWGTIEQTLFHIWENEKISWRCKGFFSYLAALAEYGYSVTTRELIKQSSDGETSVRTIVQELIGAGYIERLVTKTRPPVRVYLLISDPDSPERLNEEDIDVLAISGGNYDWDKIPLGLGRNPRTLDEPQRNS